MSDTCVPTHAPIGGWADAAQLLTELGRQLTTETDPREALRQLPRLALERLGAGDAASVTVLRRGTFVTAACTEPRARAADLVQYELGSGPCVDAVLDDAIYRPDDLRRDTRWPQFGQRVATEYGYTSMLSFRLQVPEIIAGLNIYAETDHAFTDHHVQIGTLLGVYGGIALSRIYHQDRADNLDRALSTSRDIGVAIGIIMTRHLLQRDQAFDLLRLTSQQLNRKVADLAQEVITTGALPDTHPRRAAESNTHHHRPAPGEHPHRHSHGRKN